MPKPAGGTLKPVHVAPRAAAPARPIKSFSPGAPALGPHHNPPAATPPTASNALAAEAVRIAGSPGGIDPRQMHDNLN
jgi:hypothetical protein